VRCFNKRRKIRVISDESYDLVVRGAMSNPVMDDLLYQLFIGLRTLRTLAGGRFVKVEKCCWCSKLSEGLKELEVT